LAENFTHNEGSKKAEELSAIHFSVSFFHFSFVAPLSPFSLYFYIDSLQLRFFASLCDTLRSVSFPPFFSSLSLIFPSFLPVFVLFIAAVVNKC